MPATSNPSDLLRTGDSNKLFIDSASDAETPVWVEVILVDEVAVNDDPEAVNVPGRFPDHVKRSMYGQADGSITFTMSVMKNDAIYTHLANRKRLRKAVQVQVADRAHDAVGKISITDWFMVQMPEKQPSGGNTTIEVTLTPTIVTDDDGVIIPRAYTPAPA